MQQLRIPLVGLFLALVFGVQIGSPAGQPQAGGSIRRSAPKDSSQIQLKPVSSGATATAAVNDPCGDTIPVPAVAKSKTNCIAPLPEYLKVLCELNPTYLAGGKLATLSDPAEGSQPNAVTAFANSCLGAESGKILFMLASVPDPVRTHLGLFFDRNVEAIQVAASQAGFLPYSHYLSWQLPQSDAKSDGAKSEPASEPSAPSVLVLRRQTRNAEETESETQKQTDDKFHFLVVLLISELPTRGLNSQEFRTAKHVIDVLTPPEAARPKHLWLAGPMFSGSVASLQDLDAGLGQAACIQAFSGSASNAPTVTFAKHDCPSELHLLQTQELRAFGEFVKAAKDFGYKPQDIALLSEEGTKYGSIPKTAKKEDKKNSNDEEQDNGIGDVLLLNFPREISKLRDAAGEPPAKTENNSQQQALPLPWQDPLGQKADDLPDYGAQTPNSQQAVLANISTALRVHGIKVLGLIATNPMDEAFLLRSLKQSTHDVRFLLRDPDLLYLRTPDVGSMNGTLLLNNFPLIPQNQDWSTGHGADKSHEDGGPDADHLVTFASSSQEGEYNAVVRLLEAAMGGPKDLPLLESYWPLGAAKSSYPKELPGDPDSPLWLGTIGTAGNLPLAVVTAHAPRLERGLGVNALEIGKSMFAPPLLWSLAALTGFLHVAGLIFWRRLPGRYKHDFQLIEEDSTMGPTKAACHLAGVLCITLVQWILGSGYVFFREPVPGHDSSRLYAVLCYAVIAATSLLLFAAAGIAFQIQLAGWLRPSLALPFVIFVGAGVCWGMAVLKPTLRNAFLHFRDLNLTCGVAPALPLTLLVVVLYIGIWAFIRRLAYWHYRYAHLRTLELDNFVKSDYAASAEMIDSCILGRFRTGGWKSAFWITVVASAILFRPWTVIDMLEGPAVRFLTMGFLVLVLLALWLNWFRFLSIWQSLQEILNRLETLPVKKAFDRLPHEKALPIWRWRTSDSCQLLGQVVDKVRALRAINPERLPDNVSDEFNRWVKRQECLDCVDDEQKEKEITKLIEALRPGLLAEFWHGNSRSRVAEPVAAPALAAAVPVAVNGWVILERPQWAGESSRETVPKFRGVALEAKRALSDGPINDVPKPDQTAEFNLAEDIIVLPYYDYIRHVVIELRNLLFFMVAAFCLLFAALHLYAFRTDTAIDWSMIALFLVMGSGVVIVLAQMERNALLSRLAGGADGGLSKGFYIDLIKYGTIPLLTVLGSQVPFISNNVLRWLQPAVEALR